jgi:hypothetical protein
VSTRTSSPTLSPPTNLKIPPPKNQVVELEGLLAANLRYEAEDGAPRVAQRIMSAVFSRARGGGGGSATAAAGAAAGGAAPEGVRSRASGLLAGLRRGAAPAAAAAPAAPAAEEGDGDGGGGGGEGGAADAAAPEGGGLGAR